jgi:hypothetical protein
MWAVVLVDDAERNLVYGGYYLLAATSFETALAEINKIVAPAEAQMIRKTEKIGERVGGILYSVKSANPYNEGKVMYYLIFPAEVLGA